MGGWVGVLGKHAHIAYRWVSAGVLVGGQLYVDGLVFISAWGK